MPDGSCRCFIWASASYSMLPVKLKRSHVYHRGQSLVWRWVWQQTSQCYCSIHRKGRTTIIGLELWNYVHKIPIGGAGTAIGGAGTAKGVKQCIKCGGEQHCPSNFCPPKKTHSEMWAKDLILLAKTKKTQISDLNGIVIAGVNFWFSLIILRILVHFFFSKGAFACAGIKVAKSSTI